MAAEHVERMGRRGAARREELGLTQAEVAARIPGKTDGNQVSKWERGAHKPNDQNLEQWARALDWEVSAFLADEPKRGADYPALIDVLPAVGQVNEIEDLAELRAFAVDVIVRLERVETALGDLAELLAGSQAGSTSTAPLGDVDVVVATQLRPGAAVLDDAEAEHRERTAPKRPAGEVTGEGRRRRAQRG